MRALAVLLALAVLAPICVADDVTGCGGFVQLSDGLKGAVKGKVDYSAIQLKLYKEGILKYSTECAPNGYYFIPLYDRGQFTLQIEGPEGWSFTPQSVRVSLDEKNQCNGGKDVNFQLSGFRVSGQVVGTKACGVSKSGGAKGVPGISVSLTSSQGKTSSATTDANGVYTFDNMFPDSYTVKASHPSWTITQGEGSAKLEWGSVEVATPLVVSGYDASGRVVSANAPIGGVSFFLYSKNVKSADVKCKAPAASDALPTGRTDKPLCADKSTEQGAFRFQALPCGDYEVVPFYQSALTNYDVSPAHAAFSIAADSHEFEAPFEVMGFTVSGKVVDASGKGVAGAAISVNGASKGATDKDGGYVLDHIRVGDYSIKAEKEHHTFDVLTLRITPSVARLPSINVTAYSLCGRVIVDANTKSVARGMELRRAKADAVLARTQTSAADGAYCFHGVAPGAYEVAVVLTAEEQRAGMVLVPQSQSATVAHAPVLTVNFAQARVKVSGVVKTLDSKSLDQNIAITLAAVGRSFRQTVTLGEQGAAGKNGQFEFTDVVPGAYKISIGKEEWCWEHKVQDIEVGTSAFTGIEFVQKGYQLSVVVSHDVSLQCADKSGAAKTFTATKGRDRFCLERAGQYTVTPKGCYKFEKDTYAFDTAHPEELEITAVKYEVRGTVAGGKLPREDVEATRIAIKNPNKETEKEVPLTAGKDGKAHEYVYYAAIGESIEVVPRSDKLLFYPRSLEFTLNEAACPAPLAAFEARQGLFLKGQVKPAMAGVTITVTDGEGAEVSTHTTTGAGTYSAGPLYDDRQYKLAAAKEGYHFVRAANGNDFEAVELGTIKVSVKDSAGAALGAVLISASGGDDFRSNPSTAEDGTVEFTNLFPGQYYLRPMLKEYTFEPSTSSLEIKSGQKSDVKFKAKRVAYSCYGTVSALNGEPEKGVSVEAVEAGSAGGAHEDAVTNDQGLFRLRGLQPGVAYKIHVKTGAETRLERAGPAERTVTVSNADATGVNFVAFRRPLKLEIVGSVNVSDENRKNVKIGVYSVPKNDEQSTLVLEVPVPLTRYFIISQLPRDDYEVRLTTTLSSRQYTYTLRTASAALSDAVNMRIDVGEFVFDPVAKVESAEVSNAPVYLLSLGIIAAFVGVNWNSFASLAKPRVEMQDVDRGFLPEQGKKRR